MSTLALPSLPYPRITLHLVNTYFVFSYLHIKTFFQYLIIVFNWRKTALQCFCHTTKQINHDYTYMTSLLSLPPLSPTSLITEHQVGLPVLFRHFSREDIQITNEYRKRCSTSLIIRAMQIKTAKRYYLTPVRMPIIKHLQTINAGEDVDKREPSCTLQHFKHFFSYHILKFSMLKIIKTKYNINNKSIFSGFFFPLRDLIIPILPFYQTSRNNILHLVCLII